MTSKSGYSSTLLRRKASAAIIYLARLLILTIVGYIVLYPFFYMLVTAIKDIDAMLDVEHIWIPVTYSLKSFKDIFELLDFGTALKQTFLVQISSAAIETFVCAFVAYGFARFKFPFKKMFTAMLFLTILIPDTMIIIPRVVNNSQLDFLGILALFNRLTGIDLRPNVLNTGLTFWLPSLLAAGLRSGILIFIYIQFFKGLPAELEEAAWMDGAGPIRTFIRIALPSSGVVILTVTVFSLIWHWNDYFLSSMYLTDGYPLAVWLTMMPKQLPTMGYSLVPSHPETMAVLMAGCLVFILPMLIIYIFVQRWFIESIDRVGITG